MTHSTEGTIGPGKIQTIAMLAGLLESVERGFQRTDADGYRRLFQLKLDYKFAH